MIATGKDLLKKPILPNKGAAGVKIGAGAQVVKDVWGKPLEIEQIRPDFVRWSYESVWFWFRAGRVEQVAVYAGYEGRTREGGIGIGSAREEVEGVYGALEWDGCWLINQPPFGIAFDFDRPQSGLQRVTGIYVFRE